MRSSRLPRALLTTALVCLFFLPCFSQDTLLTVAESSGYTATSTHRQVMEYLHELQKRTPYMRLETLCVSTEGRDIPLLIIGDPIPPSPAQLKGDERGVLYIQANIHAGEVEGKEAVLMLARDILLDPARPTLGKLILLIAPIFNADGNDKISKDNRRSQKGPEGGVGVRHNGQNLDLNRDAMKMESPELRGLAQNVLNTWDPFLFVDCHTTNGSYHTEPVTYLWGLNPNGDTSILQYMRDAMMPSIQKSLKKKYGIASIPYGDFVDDREPEKGWTPSGPEPRYITNYIGLRNRMSILNENYSYADYKTRVWGCYYFLKEILTYCADHVQELKAMVGAADRQTMRHPAATDSFTIACDVKPLDKKVQILGYEMETVQGEGARQRVRPTAKEKLYTVPYLCRFVPIRSVRLPFAYLITAVEPEIQALLVRHGIITERLLEPLTAEVEVFRISEMKGAEQLFQGHHVNSVKGSYTREKRIFPEGTLFVRTSQPLGKLAAGLLEPESDDGILAWNFLDRYLVSQWRRTYSETPVYRLLEPANAACIVVSPCR